MSDRCPCGGDDAEGDCMYVDSGYPWCRPCGEHHRAPECAIDEQGRALAWCGCPWAQIADSGGHLATCPEAS